ncbi:MAG: WG repeat-containing protein [Bacteroidota bacterium]
MKTLVLVFALLSFQITVAQSAEISGKYDKIGKFDKGMAIVHKGGLVGAINSDGKEVIKPEYERLSGFGPDGLSYSYKNGMVGLITKEGKVLVDNQYEYIGHFKDGYATIRKNGLTGIIDKTGKIVVDIKYDKLKCEAGGVFKATNADGTEVLVKKNE